jgi:hypothetical protein
MCLEKLKGQRGGFILVVQERLHHFHSRNEDIEKWRCRNRLSRGKVFINDDDIYDFEPHTCIEATSELHRLHCNVKLKNMLKKHGIIQI